MKASNADKRRQNLIYDIIIVVLVLVFIVIVPLADYLFGLLGGLLWNWFDLLPNPGDPVPLPPG